MEESLTITYSAPDDRKTVVAEIWLNHSQVAEINDDQGYMTIEFYPFISGKIPRIKVADLIQIIGQAIQGLGKPL